jgi:putative endonuclease
VASMTVTRRVLGTLGEQEAAAVLERAGHTIVARNYRVRGGEIDIVASAPDTLVFCEVKTRTSGAFGLPEEAVTVVKQRRLRRLAAEYMHRTGHHARDVRFDVVSVMVDGGRVTEARHIAGAF